MDLNALGGWVAAILAALGGPKILAAISARASREERLRVSIERDLALLRGIDWETPGADALRESVDVRLQNLAAVHRQRRDPFGIVLALCFIVGGVALGWTAWNSDSPARWALWIGTSLLLSFGAAGLTQDLRQVERDEKGRPSKGSH